MAFPPGRALLVSTLLAWVAPALRAQGAVELDDGRVADLFVGLTSFTLAEGLVGASYRLESGDPDFEDTRLVTLKWPWRADLDVFGRSQALHVDVVLGVLTARERGTLAAPSGPSRFAQRWRAHGLRGGCGWNFRPAEGWILRPGVGLAFTRIENEAEFDALGQSEIEPLVDGVLVNWEGWAASLEGFLTLIHEQRFGTIRGRFSGRYSLAHTDLFAATSDFQKGASSSQHVALRSQYDGPTGHTWRAESVDWTLFLAYEGDSRVEREALGFERLIETGAGLSARPFRGLPPLALTTSWITGPGIRGWSLGLSLGR